MSTKKRVTISVDPALVEAGSRAVARGDADSLSAWVSAALSEKVLHDQRRAALRAAIADYEAEFGEITEEEMAAQQRRDRENAVVIAGRSAEERPAKRRAKSA